MKPAVHAFGHVHANQGQRWLRWRLTKAAREWRKQQKASWGRRDAADAAAAAAATAAASAPAAGGEGGEQEAAADDEGGGGGEQQEEEAADAGEEADVEEEDLSHPPDDPKRGPLLGPRRAVRGFDMTLGERGGNDLRDTGVGAEADDAEGRRAPALPDPAMSQPRHPSPLCSGSAAADAPVADAASGGGVHCRRFAVNPVMTEKSFPHRARAAGAPWRSFSETSLGRSSSTRRL